MGKCLIMSSFLLLAACASRPSLDNLPSFTYMDGLVTAKTVNCSSGEALDCMACALQGEAANQPGPGIYAVGVTIMTRAGGDKNRVCKVTRARRQFEGMRRRGRRKISKKVLKVTQHVLGSEETGWTHFWAPKAQKRLKRRKPAWAHSFEKRQCRQEMIGDHMFFDTNQCKYNRNMRLNAQN